MSGRVEGKKALITGAAGGLGEAFAWMLAREGAKVALSDIDGGRAEVLAQAINTEIPGAAFAYAHDVASEEQWVSVVASAAADLGGLSVLINNAGVGGPLVFVEEDTAENWQRQYEINLLHGDALQVADQAFLFKYAAKEIALRHGMNAVFMAKPIAGEAGSSMHLHQSVVDGQGRNIFSDEAGQATPAFAHYIGGLQTYLPDLVLVFAPFVNSYRRYVTGSQAPINLQWGEDNRTAGLRVPLGAPAARRVENRLAGADANPYLAIAASLASGLAGMQERLAPTAPLVGDGYQQAHELPQTFMSAHERLRQSASAPRLLGADFVQAYLAVKRLEHDHYQAEISAWERRYLVGQA